MAMSILNGPTTESNVAEPKVSNIQVEMTSELVLMIIGMNCICFFSDIQSIDSAYIRSSLHIRCSSHYFSRSRHNNHSDARSNNVLPLTVN